MREPVEVGKLNLKNRRKALFYGETKAGKTYLMGTFPGMKEGEALIIDTDGSLSGLPPGTTKPLVYTFTVNDVLEKKVDVFQSIIELLRQMIKDINSFGRPIRTLGIDGMTNLSELLMYENMLDPAISGKHIPGYDKPVWDEYTAVLHQLTIIYNMIDDLNCHVCTTGGLRMAKDESLGTISGMVDTTGRFRERSGSRFDTVIFLENTKDGHVANTVPVGRFPACIRGYHGPKVIKNPTYDKIFDPRNFGGGQQ